jgi:hypothetical protein
MGEGGYAPGWYPVVCIGFDLSVAAYILGAYGKRGKKS